LLRKIGNDRSTAKVQIQRVVLGSFGIARKQLSQG